MEGSSKGERSLGTDLLYRSVAEPKATCPVFQQHAAKLAVHDQDVYTLVQPKKYKLSSLRSGQLNPLEPLPDPEVYDLG